MKIEIELPDEIYLAMKNNVELNSDQKGIMESIIYHAILSGIIIRTDKYVAQNGKLKDDEETT